MYKGKNILITGDSSGLGKYMALAYANKQGRIINLSTHLIRLLVELPNILQVCTWFLK